SLLAFAVAGTPRGWRCWRGVATGIMPTGIMPTGIGNTGIGNIVSGWHGFENALEGQLQLVFRNALRRVERPDVVRIPIPFEVLCQQLRGPVALFEQRLECSERCLQLGDTCLGLAQRRLALLAVSTCFDAVHDGQMHTADRAGAMKNRLCRLRLFGHRNFDRYCVRLSPCAPLEGLRRRCVLCAAASDRCPPRSTAARDR